MLCHFDPSPHQEATWLTVVQDLLISRIVGLSLETFFFGIFVVAYSAGTWLLLRGDQPRSLRTRNAILLTANTVMLALSIAVSPALPPSFSFEC